MGSGADKTTQLMNEPRRVLLDPRRREPRLLIPSFCLFCSCACAIRPTALPPTHPRPRLSGRFYSRPGNTRDARITNCGDAAPKQAAERFVRPGNHHPLRAACLKPRRFWSRASSARTRTQRSFVCGVALSEAGIPCVLFHDLFDTAPCLFVCCL